MNEMANDDLVDMQRYPIDQPRSTIYKTVVADAQQQLADDGCPCSASSSRHRVGRCSKPKPNRSRPARGTANRW